MKAIVVCFSVLLGFYGAWIWASPKIVEGQYLVRLNGSMGADAVREMFGGDLVEQVELLVPDLDLYLVKVKPSRVWANADTYFRRWGQVKYAQEDHVVSLRQIPNDPHFGQQWNFGKAGAYGGMGAVDAWALGTGGEDIRGNDIVAAVVDAGVDLSHPDLQPNLWVNKAEIAGNGIDDDGNGYVDDIHGWNAYYDNGMIPSEDHGTHVAGIIGASGNNGLYGVGVNWKVKIMAVAGSSSASSIVARAYGYVMVQKKLWLESKGEKGANIVVTNSSFGVDFADCASDQFKVWNDLYDAMGALGILSAAAAPNLDINVDEKGDVPTGCSSPFLIAVTNTTKENRKYQSAGVGKKHVDLGAPGTGIVSTIPNNEMGTMTGTSMATPHVSGAVAFLHSIGNKSFNDLYLTQPAVAALGLKELLIRTVDPLDDLKDVSVSGGRLNLYQAATYKNSFYY